VPPHLRFVRCGEPQRHKAERRRIKPSFLRKLFSTARCICSNSCKTEINPHRRCWKLGKIRTFIPVFQRISHMFAFCTKVICENSTPTVGGRILCNACLLVYGLSCYQNICVLCEYWLVIQEPDGYRKVCSRAVGDAYDFHTEVGTLSVIAL
jgi:hypothetical protein